MKCFQDNCTYGCLDYPKMRPEKCLCDNTTVCEEGTSVCQNATCKARPPTDCQDVTYADDEGCKCLHENGWGAVCQTEQMCVKDHRARCLNILPCASEPSVNSDEFCYCNKTSSLCNQHDICHSTQSRCIPKCPDFPHSNQKEKSCHCGEKFCPTEQACGSSGQFWKIILEIF